MGKAAYGSMGSRIPRIYTETETLCPKVSLSLQCSSVRTGHDVQSEIAVET